MLADTIDALDRARAYCVSYREDTDHSQFFAEARGFLEFLRHEQRLSRFLDDLLCEGRKTVEQFRSRDGAIVSRLEEIQKCIEAHTASSGSGQPSSLRVRAESWQLSVNYTDSSDRSRSRNLLTLVREKLSALDENDRAKFAAQINDEELELRSMREHWLLFSRTSHGAAAIRLSAAIHYLMAEERDSATSTADSTLVHDLHRLASIRQQVYGEHDTLFGGDSVQVAQDDVWSALESTYHGVRTRVGTTLSLRNLVERFRMRSERYDAAELRSLADSAKRSAENMLTDRLARFLFDQGLNPLTRPLVGKVQPDLYDRDLKYTLYVEAKQYRKREEAKHVIVKGARQIWDTLGSIATQHGDPREAFYVIFRRGGPRCALPPEVCDGDRIIYPVLVDIAKAEVSGSRQKEQPILIDKDDLLPRRP
jgi:hypothetical protein